MSIYRGRNRKDFFLTATLYDAIEDHNMRAVELLITKKGADPNIVLPRVGISPFHLVIGNDSEQFAINVTKLILQHCGNPNVRSDDGLIPLHIAAAWGRCKIMELLLYCGGDPDIQDSNGFTPLDYAMEYQHSEIIVLLKQFIAPESIICVQAEEHEAYNLTLDKVVVNNGCAIGEYKPIDPSLETNCSSFTILGDLPEYEANEYVENWFKEHLEKSKLSRKNINPQPQMESDHHHSFDSTFSDESDKLISNGFSLSNINCKPRDKTANMISSKWSMSDDSILKSEIFTQNYKTKKKIYEQDDFCKYYENSRESGIMTLPDDSVEYMESNVGAENETYSESITKYLNNTNDAKDIMAIKGSEKMEDCTLFSKAKDTSSDYFTCNEVSSSLNSMEKNIFEITSDLSGSSQVQPSHINIHSNKNPLFKASNLDNHVTNVPGQVSKQHSSVSCESLVSISEVYKYTDRRGGVVLYEKRLLVNCSGESRDSEKSGTATHSSKLSSLPASVDYDTDVLRQELQCSGYNPGPITKTTKRLYLRKLHQLKKEVIVSAGNNIHDKRKVFSYELEDTLKDPSWSQDLSSYKQLEESISKEFSCPDHKKRWREGVNKSSFTYLLLDPRITNNLPCRAEKLPTEDVWKTFLSSIFYVGKGKRSRPYAHLYEAVGQWNTGMHLSSNTKIQRVLDIWKENKGVVCLHVFLNVIPVEAYTREAAMITALKLENIENVKRGDFYGVASTWDLHQKKMLGVYLLFKAMQIFLNEGERQLSPGDIN